MTAVQLGASGPPRSIAFAQCERQALGRRLLFTTALQQFRMQHRNGLLLPAVRGRTGIDLRTRLRAGSCQLSQHLANCYCAPAHLHPVGIDADAQQGRQREARDRERADQARSTDRYEARADHFFAPPNCAWPSGLVARPLVMM